MIGNRLLLGNTETLMHPRARAVVRNSSGTCLDGPQHSVWRRGFARFCSVAGFPFRVLLLFSHSTNNDQTSSKALDNLSPLVSNFPTLPKIVEADDEKDSIAFTHFHPPPTPRHFHIQSGPQILGPKYKPSRKTLVLDLDETLIHSLSRGSRISSAYMIEVKLGTQRATLYYVYKRPYCDEFLKEVSKWYDLVVFTASMKEYADPVIDWLESDQKYFSKKFYKHNCTYLPKKGCYVKDLSVVEKDLSKIIILDNSPSSYAFHKDNAISIESWANDIYDTDLLHLIPVLKSLCFVSDVRALLSLKRSEAAFAEIK